MKKILLIIVSFALALCLSAAIAAPSSTGKTADQTVQNDGAAQAKAVIERTFGFFPKNVRFVMTAKTGKTDTYALTVSHNTLTVEGTSPVAICKGFHDYILENGYGISSWTGNRLSFPKRLAARTRTVTVSPYQHHLYYNVCTFGYSTPFWSWEDWQKEIDWMALHGFDMPLSPIGGETILSRVWKQFGLTQEEIDDYFTGPAHFPWMRMGNIAHFQGGMSQQWFDNQIALEHKINDRELALGMTPVYQGFAGFVPRGIVNHYPDVKLTVTKWSSFDETCLNHMLSPKNELFSKIGTAFIKEWEREFGKGTYYLIDSFNEMDIPFGAPGSKEVQDAMREYGRTIYQSVKAADPDAVWVMQGWILGYQRSIWTPETLKALLSEVPDDKMVIIDLAVDFNEYVWKNARSWDFYDGFFNKQWIWSTTPNFGDRTAPQGPVDFYLNEALRALDSPNKGNLVGCGTSPEGIENNEITYEAISSSAWSSQHKDAKAFLSSYDKARYGSDPAALKTFWNEMLQSVHGGFTNSAHFAWQRRPPYRGKTKLIINEHFYRGIESFLSASDQFSIKSQTDAQGRALYQADAVMWATFYLSARVDESLTALYKALDAQDLQKAKEIETLTINMLNDMDKLLESHPIYSTQRWMDKAYATGTNPQEKEHFVLEAKRLITTWGGATLYDYASKIWSGIIRDYYAPRLKYYFDNAIAGVPVDMATFDESHFPTQPTLSPSFGKYDDPVAAAKQLVASYGPKVEAITAQAAAVAAKVPDYTKAAGTLRLMQYNVGAFSKVLKNSAPVVARMVKEIDADVISLNELDSCNTRHGNYQLQEFSECMGGWHYIYQRSMPYKGGTYGIGIASKAKILEHFGIILSKDAGAEPRALVVIETPDYVFASTHLDNVSSFASQAQAKVINQVMKERYGDSTKPVFLAGDMNSDPLSYTIAEFKKEWTVLSQTTPTIPATAPTSCIDYIMALNNKAEYTLVKSYVCTQFKSGDVKETSDHLPVFVDVKL